MLPVSEGCIRDGRAAADRIGDGPSGYGRAGGTCDDNTDYAGGAIFNKSVPLMCQVLQYSVHRHNRRDSEYFILEYSIFCSSPLSLSLIPGCG